jgi:hypothetical protein
MSNFSSTKYNIDVIIDSKYRRDYSTTNSNNFIIDIPSRIEGQIVRYGLKSCMIPNTILLGGDFEIEDSVGVKTITIPNGNYTALELGVEIETQLNAAGSDTYTVVLDGNKYNITSSFNDFTINPNDLINADGILYKIGFGISGIYVATAGVLTSYAGINLSSANYIFVDIEQFNKHIKNTDGTFHNFIIPNTCGYGEIISFRPESTFIQQFLPYNILTPNNVNSLTVSLRYENDTLIDLQNSDWIFVLSLEVISNYVP